MLTLKANRGENTDARHAFGFSVPCGGVNAWGINSLLLLSGFFGYALIKQATHFSFNHLAISSNAEPSHIEVEQHKHLLLSLLPLLTHNQTLFPPHEYAVMAAVRISDFPVFVRMLYDYNDDDVRTLSLRAGDILEVFYKSERGWWDGVIENERGWFPSNYCVVISGPGEDRDGMLAPPQTSNRNPDNAAGDRLPNGTSNGTFTSNPNGVRNGTSRL